MPRNDIEHRRGAGDSIIHSHSYKPTLQFHKTRKDNAEEPFMGFELEAGGATYDGMDDAAYEVMHEIKSRNVCLCHDGTIPSYGFEMVSQPFTLDAHADAPWAKMLDICMSHELKSHDLGDRVGIHVHITRNRTTEEMWRLADAFANLYRSDFEKMARRGGTDYCAYYAERVLGGRCCIPGNSSNRYRAINFQNENTIEFRMFNGSLIHNTLLATLEIVHSLWAVLHKHEMDYATLVPRPRCFAEDYVAAVELFKADWLKELVGNARYARALSYVKDKCAFASELKQEARFVMPEPVEMVLSASAD